MRPLPLVGWILPFAFYLLYLYAEVYTDYSKAPVYLYISAVILIYAYSHHVYKELRHYVDTTMTNRWRDILNIPAKDTK